MEKEGDSKRSYMISSLQEDIRGVDILFHDAHLIAVNKLSGVACIPGRHMGKHVSLKEQLQSVTGRKIFTVHRIDRDTSGLVLFAGDAATHRFLCRQFERRQVQKRYLAVVDGLVRGDNVIDEPLRQFGSGRTGISPEGKPSRTRYEVVESFASATLLNVSPETGRRHQIRAHLYHAGHPVLGDRLYGRDRPVGGTRRLMLHALSIALFYPERTPFTVTAPVSGEWEDIVAELRKTVGKNQW